MSFTEHTGWTIRCDGCTYDQVDDDFAYSNKEDAIEAWVDAGLYRLPEGLYACSYDCVFKVAEKHPDTLVMVARAAWDAWVIFKARTNEYVGYSAFWDGTGYKDVELVDVELGMV